MSDCSKTIVLREFQNIIDAQMAMDILKQNGVECFISNQFVNQLYPMFPSSVAGVKLNVLENDSPKAELLLDTFLKEK